MSGRRVALITGATGGLGPVLAADLAADGWDLVLCGSDQARLDTLEAQPGLEAARVLSVSADLRLEHAAQAAVAAAYERYGRVDALAHLVGGWTGGTNIVDATDEPYRSMLEQHLWSTLNILRALVPRMITAGHGRIVAVSSPTAASPGAGMSAYGVGKAAEETLLAALASEVVGTGVTVNVVRVRTIDTTGVRDRDPHGRGASMTRPAELSAAIRYLFSEAAGVVNGERIGLHSGL
jgi:NAD(P)-dependent dehydrogenase (short-subunit alcohol dehydrogenase family)